MSEMEMAIMCITKRQWIYNSGNILVLLYHTVACFMSETERKKASNHAIMLYLI